MAQYHGSTGLVKDGSDIVGELKSWSFSSTAETYQTLEPTLSNGSPALTFIGGPTSGTGSCEGLWAGSDTGQVALVIGTVVTLSLFPTTAAGTGLTSDPSYSFSAVITSVDIGTSVDALVSFSANFQISGAITADLS